MTARKTVEVADIQEFVNHNLQRDNLSEEAKAGMCSLLEKVLHDTGNYRGFMYDGGYKGTEEVKETEEHNFHCQPEMMIEWIFEQGKVSFNVEKA
jgi:hypothetical protein